MIKLVACDLDGTLLDEEHKVPKENAIAIKRLQDAGIQFMTATGRTYDSVAPLLEPYGITCVHLLVNGALMKDQDGKILYENPMELSHVKTITDILIKEDLCFNLYTQGGSMTPDIEKARREFIEHMKQNGMQEAEIIEMMEQASFCQYEREVNDMEAFLKESPIVYKMETFGGDVEVSRRVRKKLSEVEGLALSDSISENIEITKHSAQKGYTLKHYCDEQGIKLDEVVVIGDSMNDLSMMKMFPHSVAVANASSMIKEAAHYITKSNHEFGVAHVLNQIGKKPFHL
ncbi:HAD family hydrolase [[Eubacterium] hominis]|uniref:HAD family hydrolase n=1 Tax=[Eubacterium] hominis TaxID=2764325 RepID=UPI003A4E5089